MIPQTTILQDYQEELSSPDTAKLEGPNGRTYTEAKGSPKNNEPRFNLDLSMATMETQRRKQ